jgi:hypothetical protein
MDQTTIINIDKNPSLSILSFECLEKPLHIRFRKINLKLILVHNHYACTGPCLELGLAGYLICTHGSKNKDLEADDE